MPSLVSCIMPTANRRAFVPRACELFLRQDYPAKELIIVDDGEVSVSDLIPDDPRIRYYFVAGATPASIGVKRNFACGLARGDFIAHWDDDDWQARRRLSVQIESMRTSDAVFSGLMALAFYQPATEQAWLYRSVRSPWMAGGTFVYRRDLAQRFPFTAVNNGEDVAFLDAVVGAGLRVAGLDEPSLYVTMLHGGNTVTRRQDRQWGGLPVETVKAWIAAEEPTT